MKPALAVLTTAAAVTVGLACPPFASADTEVAYLGQQGELVDGDVVQGWTISDLRPSTDTIPYPVAGTLWEATATDEAIAGSATPIVSNLNARAASGQSYRVLFGVASTQGINPATLAQGQKTTGKIYFDVTGDSPDSVFYNAGGQDLLLWVPAPPPPATGSSGGYTAPAPARTAAPAEAETTEPTATTEPTTESTEAVMPPAPEGSSGTPLPEGSSGTPLPEGSTGTPLPEDAAPAPAAVAPAPEGSTGTPMVEGSSGTPLPENVAPTTTTVVPAPPA
ncbi:MPT63 family protein [Mycolicibacterium xanthum]|uniref:MPT63 family protein n=1 Tax=Mycolicibacterium xanthum TaxID=2796469 RepID=UPI00210570EC